ncbi:MAG: helix-turn-helix transcriptional regulator [Eubacterium sp.]|nr:helix-turn-helix transcriptional regulator [Eubacterium sp.]
MDAHNIKRNALARKIDTRFEVIDKWYNGSLEKIDADVLARICFVLDCTPGDLITYVAGEKGSGSLPARESNA